MYNNDFEKEGEYYGILKIDIVGSTLSLQNTAASAIATLVELQKRLKKLLITAKSEISDAEIFIIREDGDAAWLVSQKINLLVDLSELIFKHLDRENTSFRESGLKGRILSFRIALDFDQILFIPEPSKPERAFNFLSYAGTICSRIESEIKPCMLGATSRFYNRLREDRKKFFGDGVNIKGKNLNEYEQKIYLSEYKENELIPVNQYFNLPIDHKRGVEASLLYDREAIKKATKFILEKSKSTFYQTHFLSNPIREEEDYLKHISEMNLPNLSTYIRIVGVSNNNDLEFANRSVDYKKVSKVSTQIKILKSIELSNQVDRLPNFAVSEDVAMLSFPSRSERDAFAIILADKQTVSRLKLWLENFGNNLPLAKSILPIIEDDIKKSSQGYLNKWVIDIISWALITNFGKSIKCISKIGSFADSDNDPMTISDMDLLIVLDSKKTAKIDAIKRIIEKISNFFTRYGRIYRVNYNEGPIYENLHMTDSVQLIHIMINTEDNIANWPLHIKKYRRSQHQDLHGHILDYIKIDDTHKYSDYTGENFGYEGLKKNLIRGNVLYRTWNGSKRTNYRYYFDKSALSLTSFSLYCVIKSMANMNDLMFHPGYYDSWDGSVDKLYQAIILNCPNSTWKDIFRKSIDLQKEIRLGEYKPSMNVAVEWKERAINLLDDILVNLRQ